MDLIKVVEKDTIRGEYYWYAKIENGKIIEIGHEEGNYSGGVHASYDDIEHLKIYLEYYMCTNKAPEKLQELYKQIKQYIPTTFNTEIKEKQTMINYEQMYKEALKRATIEFDSAITEDTKNVIAKIFKKFSEDNESKDEKIRKSLIKTFKNQHSCNFPTVDGFSREEILTWLAQQKSTEWGEEDEKMLNKIQDHLREFYVDKKGYPYIAAPDSPEVIESNWLNSLKDRVQPQPKQEWSEEDESMHTRCIGILGKCKSGIPVNKVDEELNWLKSLKPQPKQKIIFRELGQITI